MLGGRERGDGGGGGEGEGRDRVGGRKKKGRGGRESGGGGVWREADWSERQTN